MKIRRRSHPIDPRKSNPGTNADGFRMRRHSPDLYNRHGDPIDRVAIQAAVLAATRAHASGEKTKESHIIGHRWA